MSLVHAENFGYYGTDETLMSDGIYATVNGVTLENDPDGLSAEKVLQLAFTSNFALRYVLPAAHATVGVALRMWLTAIPSADTSRPTVVSWRNGSNVIIASLVVTPTGAFSFINGNGTVATSTTSGPVITANGWYHIEAKLVCDTGGAGTFEVRVEGVPVMELTGLTTGVHASAAQVAHGAGLTGVSGTNWYMKDYVVWDGAGTANNDFLGSVFAYELTPTADVDFPTGWSSTGADGYSILDNDPPLDGVAYISADDSPPAVAVFSLSNVPADVTSVKGLITRVRMAKADGGDGQMMVSLRSNGVDDNGADRPLTTAQTYWSDVSELDPDTAAAWTPGAVDAAQLVLERTV